MAIFEVCRMAAVHLELQRKVCAQNIRWSTLSQHEDARLWLGHGFLAAHLHLKRSEIKALEGLEQIEVCQLGAAVY
jgi:hypothetical protein